LINNETTNHNSSCKKTLVVDPVVVPLTPSLEVDKIDFKTDDIDNDKG